MFELRDVTFSYGDRPVLDHVDLAVDHGELMLLAGPTGVGKSTLLGVVAGLVPAFTGGTLTGDVVIDGESVLERPARERAHVVGYVGQNPPAWFVTDTVEEELAFGMEQLGLAAPRRCAAGSRRRSTCSASPTSATATCAPCPAASSSGSPSAPSSPRTRGCWCSTSRPPPSTRPRPRTCSPRSPGWSTTSGSRSSSPSTGSSGWFRSPTGSACWGRAAERPGGGSRRAAGRLPDRPAAGRARPARRLVAAPAHRPRRASSCAAPWFRGSLLAPRPAAQPRWLRCEDRPRQSLETTVEVRGLVVAHGSVRGAPARWTSSCGRARSRR